MNNPIDISEQYFNKGFACSQSVLAAFASQYGLDEEVALKIAAPFGGGMCRTGKVCGAVSGALMVIGLRFGQIKAEDKETKENVYALGRLFSDRFKSLHGSVMCTDLLGYDLSVLSEAERGKYKDLFKSRCINFVKDATRLVQGIIED
jgi:C_GCAxxG_C_C family probable redox protein